MISAKPSALILSLSATIAIVGCGGVSRSPVTTTGSTFNGSSLSGKVKGGQQPVSGATIQLYQVGTAGDGSGAAPLGSSTTTDSTGSFTITGNYTCPGSNPQVYLLATGGNPGLASGTNNTAIDLIAALGSCSSLSSSTIINLNEVTTVAAVAALLPYMTSPTSIGSGTSDAAGLTAAFTLASQFASTATGTSPGTSVPAGDAVPSTLINSLADIVSACVNSTGGYAGDGGSPCGTLFTDSTPAGGPAPTDVATALLDILNNPTSNVTPLFGLLTSTPPFEPVLSAAPPSWEIGLIATPAGGALVDYGTTYQTIQGFGGSTAWLGQMPAKAATALFSPTKGLGLSILRVRIDPEGLPTGGGNYGAPYETSQWDYELTNAKEAVAANPQTVVFASPWTAPAAMKTSSTSQPYSSCTEGTGYCGGYLNPTSYAAYASYLEDFVSFFNTHAGFDLYSISMQNEPDQNATYESCLWTPQQMDTWVANNASTITSDQYSTPLMMPESNSFVPAQAATALSDPSAEPLISIVAGHIYQVLFSGSITAYPWPAGVNPKPLWMTEFGPLSSSAPSWSTALSTYALAIHNSMVTGRYNAYVWWGAFGASTGSCATAAGTCGLVDANGNVTVTGEVMGQYSKFIRPGYVVASATATPVTGVYLSAYTGSGHEVIVAINTTSSAVALPIQMVNQTVTSMTPYQSTSSSSLSQLSPVTVTDNEFSAALPAASITTYVQ